MPDDKAELERRRAAAAAGGTDRARWENAENLSAIWDERARLAAGLVPRGARVLDLGCGAMALERFLPPYCDYIPCDLVARDGRTLVCDFNAQEFPDPAECDVAVALGVLEYLADAPAFLRRLHQLGRTVVVSYNLAGESPPDRRALGWVNDYSRAEFGDLLRTAGFTRATAYELGHGQILVRAEPAAPPRTAEKIVWVVSYFTTTNFGDRLGQHLLSQVLPGQATIRNVSMQYLDRLPSEEPDLVVLGIGNSVYGPIVGEPLLRILDRAPRAIGIFGTQYRESLPRESLTPILDRLDRWHARYEEDALIYGRGRNDVRHLGDWLVDAFPMAQGLLDETLELKSSDVHGPPLDRLISHIQAYRRVTSPRLHPLLCALTSAEQVAYAEQAESEVPGLQSGKFRSMLLDVFGREMPPQRLWSVDRSAVVAYKQKVKQNIGVLRDDIAALLA